VGLAAGQGVEVRMAGRKRSRRARRKRRANPKARRAFKLAWRMLKRGEARSLKAALKRAWREVR